MVKRWIGLVLLIIFFLLGGLARGSEPPFIVTTFTILEDLTKNVTRDGAHVLVITPPGAEVHEWLLTPENFVHIERADLILYNGLNLEQWMDQVKAVARPNTPVIAIGEVSGFPTLPILTGDYKGDKDPHLWMDVRGAMAYVETIARILGDNFREWATQYQENASAYLEELSDLHQYLQITLSRIPEEKRILITTEAAFNYFGAAYGFHHDGIWGTNTEEEGTPAQFVRIYELLISQNPQAIFWESTGSSRYVQGLSEDTGIPFYGPLYVDSVKEGSSHGSTYIGMMEENARLLVLTLKNEMEGER